MTSSTQDLLRRLTMLNLPDSERRRSLNRFTRELGWRPSGLVDGFSTRSFAAAHLVVEHGLENSAVISFLGQPYSRLDLSQQKALLSISYNNLVDWHISIDEFSATILFNRVDPPKVVERVDLQQMHLQALRAEMFEQLVGRRPSSNIPAVDDALIRTISHWKRLLVADLQDSNLTNEHLSALFNAIIFARAVEDHSLRLGQPSDEAPLLLREVWDHPKRTIEEHIGSVLRNLTGDEIPEFLVGWDHLSAFNSLDAATLERLYDDFYQNRFSRYYRYDFAVMSKHALSRIYEHYVSMLRVGDDPQSSLFPEIPEEHLKRHSGSVYTPEFIARFFARVLRDNIAPRRFRELRSIDPACGSGIFLRTLAETQCDPFTEFPADIRDVTRNAVGLDIDENAAQAARLSLALLHLVLTNGELPSALPIFTSDAFTWVEEEPGWLESFDAVIANPPFVAIERQPEGVRERIRDALGALATGRTDAYLAFLHLATRLLRPGGYGLFVVPHSFLISDAARLMREALAETCIIRYLVDLSGVQVFEHVDAYVVLLVFQRRGSFVEDGTAVVARAKELVGNALEATLEGKETETPYFSVERTTQERFQAGSWVVLPPSEAALRKRIEAGPKLSDLCHVRLGFITGADDVFTMGSEEIPEGEEGIYRPFLRDRDMLPWSTPESTEWVVFYPYQGSALVTEDELMEEFPGTFAYLSKHRAKLKERAAVKRDQLPWWRPERPRPPRNMLVPKLVTPHLVITPRFSLDDHGTFAVSRSPMVMLKGSEAGESDPVLLRILLGLLNSSPCFWHMAHTSHRYQSGYSMLEPKTLLNTPLPDLDSIDPTDLKEFFGLVERMMESGAPSEGVGEEIDEMSAKFFGLGSRERRLLGLQSHR